MPRGGKREGAGRKQGSNKTNYTTTFYVRCTEEEKELLKNFLAKIRNSNPKI